MPANPSEPLVSVVMSVYNGATHLEETLQSIRSQRGVTFEAIVVDDGSTDRTPAILAGHADWLTVVRQPNQGLTRALRAGCQLARGKYIARHDNGDLSAPTRLQVQSDLLQANASVVLVSAATRYVGPAGEELWIDHGKLGSEPRSVIDLTLPWGLVGGPTHHGSVMMRTDAYRKAGGYRTAFYYGQDWDLWYRLAELGQFQLSGEVLYTARIEPGSISALGRSEQSRLAALSVACLRSRLAKGDDSELLEQAERIRPAKKNAATAVADGYYFIGSVLLRRERTAARRYLVQAIRSKPWMLRAWVRWLQTHLGT